MIPYKKKNQTKIIHEEILKQINSGDKNMHSIYNKVIDNLQIPRPTIRRAKGVLLKDLEEKVKILKNETVTAD